MCFLAKLNKIFQKPKNKVLQILAKSEYNLPIHGRWSLSPTRGGSSEKRKLKEKGKKKKQLGNM
jgi:hypothetical protein